ncbi:MAG: diguanylate cyclase response regulator [Elusimicrobia bacterium CG_4_10_14_0_2_um_filter_56_8]|nr:MAG: diguanylate cyclase response regulator [Elusimicrobia bacterium CG_4_10_14_0_2_um_filter_56_8]
MNKKLLVADDDKSFREILTRIFKGSDWQVSGAEDGITAFEQISAQTPDVILLDLNMPRLGGRELLARLRKDARYSMIPIIIVSGNDSPQEKAADLGIGADDFVSKPFDIGELTARIESAFRRARRMLAANPLTFLPGGPAIEEEAALRIKSADPLAFFYIDIDNFKAYNDKYGYLNGDTAIKQTAALLNGLKTAFPAEEVFTGHIGGDDFVLMARPEKAEEIARALASGFDALATKLYNREDGERGFIVSKDRMGKMREFPLMTLTIAIATNEKRELGHYAKIVDIVSEIKKHLKGLKDRFGSMYLKDRRVD